MTGLMADDEATRSSVALLRAIAGALETAVDSEIPTAHLIGPGVRGLIVDALRSTAVALEQLAGRNLAEALYPTELTSALREVLGSKPWELQPIAGVLRMNGQDIARRFEAEQAAALHWLTLIALAHGDGWRSVARERLLAIVANLKAREGEDPG